MGADQARHAIEMATVLAGSREALRERPVLSDLHLLDRAAGPGPRRARGGARLRRGRHPGRAPGDADARHDGAGDLGRRPGRRRRRGHLRRRAAPAGLPGRPGVPLDHEGLGRSADRRLRRLLARRSRALRAGRDGASLGPAVDGRLLRHGFARGRHLAGGGRGRARPAPGRPGRRRARDRARARPDVHAALPGGDRPRRRPLPASAACPARRGGQRRDASPST